MVCSGRDEYRGGAAHFSLACGVGAFSLAYWGHLNEAAAPMEEKKPTSKDWGEVFRRGADRLLETIFGPTAVVSTAAIWFASTTLNTWLLSPKDRLAYVTTVSSTAARLAGDNVHSDWFCYGGWVTSGVLLVVGVPFVVIQHLRIRKKGTAVSVQRGKEDPERLSSLDPTALLQYPAKAEKQGKEEGKHE